MNRAHSWIEFRAVDEEKRIIEGIATTPQLARDGDIIVTEGIQFKLPIPFLFGHSSQMPLGNVVRADVGKDGIKVRVQMAPQGTADFIDEKWRLIRAGVVRGLSIGWRTLEEEFDKAIKGFRILKSEWLELSAVPVPADANATITSVRSADTEILAALGHSGNRSVVRLTSNSPGVSGLTKGKAMPKKPIAEQIVDFANLRAAKQARIDELVELSASESRTFNEAEKEEQRTLRAEIKDIDEHLVTLRDYEESLKARATTVTVTPTATVSPEQAAAAMRRGEPIQVSRNEPKGIGMARMAIAMVRSHKEHRSPVEIAQQLWKDSPEVAQYVRTAVEAGDTTTSGWASQLLPAAQSMANEFIEMLRAKTLIGRIPLREVPFNVSVPLQSGAGTYGWVGEGAPKPVTKPTYGSATLRFEKAAGIIVITQELARFSSPSAELLVRNEMLNGLARHFDSYFVSNAAAVTNVAPAGILNGISSTTVTGTTAAKFRVDMNTIIQKMIVNNQNPADLVILMSSGMAMGLSSMITTLGTQEFPSINATGGNYLGIPIVDSQAVGNNIILLNPNDILHAADPSIRIDVSTEATVEMDTAPTAGESSPITDVATIKSLWQNNLVGIRAEQFNTWVRSRTSAVEYLINTLYVPS